MESLVKRPKTEEKACFGWNTHGGRKKEFSAGSCDKMGFHILFEDASQWEHLSISGMFYFTQLTFFLNMQIYEKYFSSSPIKIDFKSFSTSRDKTIY